jgi:hypothetical protein
MSEYFMCLRYCQHVAEKADANCSCCHSGAQILKEQAGGVSQCRRRNMADCKRSNAEENQDNEREPGEFLGQPEPGRRFRYCRIAPVLALDLVPEISLGCRANGRLA